MTNPGDRISALREDVFARVDAGVRKTTFYGLVSKSLRETAGQPTQIRRALCLKHLLENVKLDVHPYELLGGSISGMWPLDPDAPSYQEQYRRVKEAVEATIHPELAVHKETTIGASPGLGKLKKNMKIGRFALMARDHYNANMDYLEMQKLTKQLQDEYAGDKRIKPQDIARLSEDTCQYDYGADVMQPYMDLPYFVANHISLNYGKAIREGYSGILQDIERRLAAAEDPDKHEFYEAAKISIAAAIDYVKRYAKAFEEAAQTEADAVRQDELYEIASILDKVATEKPETFREALQLVWITHIIANTALGNALSLSRFDQYMAPFYQKDIDAGRITGEEAEELLACMMLKINEPKMRTVQSLVLGGTTTDGKNGCNELTRTVLRAARQVRLPYPNIALRVAGDLTPEWAYDEAMETIRLGFGMPMIVNDDVWIPNFESLGYRPEDARNYFNMGCVEMMIQHKQRGWLMVPGAHVSYPELMEQQFDDVKAGKVAFETYDDMIRDYEDRIRRQIRSSKIGPDYRFMTEAGCDAFGSVFTDGCLESGVDMFKGGSELPGHISVGGMGLATTVDSFSAIRKVVFETKKKTLAELIDIVRNNFEGEEYLRQYILNNTDFYGNDIPDVDTIGSEFFRIFTDEVHALNDGTVPHKYVSTYFSYTMHVAMGEVTPATPDGRLFGEPLSDGLGPSQGRDCSGPTRLLGTLLGLSYAKLTGALATNIKVNANIFNTQSGIEAFKQMIRAYLINGGPQVQVNFVTTEDLLDAQINPHQHRDLVVRIAGFCEHFIYLDINQQNEIIKRSEHEMA